MDNKIKTNNTNKISATTNLKDIKVTKPLKGSAIKSNKKDTKKVLIRNILISFSLLALLDLILFSTVLGGVQIEGRVLDAKDTNTILTGVDITLDNKKTIENNNLTSNFVFNKVSKGKHTIKASRGGYKIYEKEIEVTSKMKFDIFLEPISKFEKKSNIKIVVNNMNTSNLTIIEPELENKITNIIVADRPVDIVTIKEKQKLYSSSPSQGVISVVDLNSKLEINKITFDKHYQLTRMELSPSHDKLYVFATGSAKMFIIDTNTDKVTSEFEIKGLVTDFKVDKVSGNLIVLDNDKISILNPAGSLIREHKFTTSSFYEKLILNGNDTVAFVTHASDPIILKVNINTNEETTINLKERARDVIYDDIKQILYILHDSSLEILNDGKFDNYKPTIETKGNKSISLFKDNNKIYIVNMNSSNISVLNTDTFEIEDKMIPAGQYPSKLIMF